MDQALLSLISTALGGAIGAGSTMLVQLQTNRREMLRISREDTREKTSRLRPQRIALLFEVSGFLRELLRHIETLSGRTEHDDTDWDQILGLVNRQVEPSHDIGS